MIKLNRGKNAGGFNSDSERESDSDESEQSDYDLIEDHRNIEIDHNLRDFDERDEGFGERDEEGFDERDEEGFGERDEGFGEGDEGFGEGDEGFGEGDERGVEQAPSLQAERDAFDRTSGIHTLLANCGKYTGNKTLQNNLTYEEIIACDINKVFNRYRTSGEDSIISKQDLYSLLDDIDNKKIPNIQYKNGLGLLLGYYIYKNGLISYNKDQFNINKILINDSDLTRIMNDNIDNIVYPDLIRYTRLWYDLKR